MSDGRGKVKERKRQRANGGAAHPVLAWRGLDTAMGLSQKALLTAVERSQKQAVKKVRLDMLLSPMHTVLFVLRPQVHLHKPISCSMLRVQPREAREYSRVIYLHTYVHDVIARSPVHCTGMIANIRCYSTSTNSRVPLPPSASRSFSSGISVKVRVLGKLFMIPTVKLAIMTIE